MEKPGRETAACRRLYRLFTAVLTAVLMTLLPMEGAAVFASMPETETENGSPAGENAPGEAAGTGNIGENAPGEADGTEEDTETGRMPEMVVGSFDLPASSSVEETEPDWTQFAPELDENGEFHLDVEYIEAYGEDSVQDLIFYGDSRVVGMAYTTGGYHYVGKEGAGCDWMQGEGLSYLEDQMTQWPEADIVFCFGVNDPGSIEQYLQFYRSYTPLFPERRFWFLSVNPVYDALAAAGGFSAQNRLIDDFNVRLEEEFPEGYLDSCSYLREYGYNAPDGVHYDGATYYAIQDYCRREIMRRLEE